MTRATVSDACYRELKTALERAWYQDRLNPLGVCRADHLEASAGFVLDLTLVRIESESGSDFGCARREVKGEFGVPSDG